MQKQLLIVEMGLYLGLSKNVLGKNREKIDLLRFLFCMGRLKTELNLWLFSLHSSAIAYYLQPVKNLTAKLPLRSF